MKWFKRRWEYDAVKTRPWTSTIALVSNNMSKQGWELYKITQVPDDNFNVLLVFRKRY